MLPFPVVGVVVMGIVGEAFEVPNALKFQGVVPKAVLDPAFSEDEDILKGIKTSVDNLVKASSSVAGDVSRIQSAVEENQKSISEMAEDVSRIKSMMKQNQKSIPEMTEYVYNMTVYTGSVDGAGTDGDVMVQLIGELGVSREQYPDSSRDDFERGAADSFLIAVAPLGTLTEIQVNCTEQNAWFLDKIVLNKANMPERYTFNYNNWVNGTVRIFASSE